jgi:hypothetical protein
MAIGEFATLESAKTQALWIEQNNKRGPKEISWRDYAGETMGVNPNAPTCIYEVRKWDNKTWNLRVSTHRDLLSAFDIAKFGSCDEAKLAAEKLNECFTDCR